MQVANGRWAYGLLLTVCASALGTAAKAQGTTLPPVSVDPPAERRRAPVTRPTPAPARTATRARAARRSAQAPRPQVRAIAAPAAPVAERAPAPLPGGTDAGGARGPVPGYVASRSVVGTKTDTPILETAQSISVIGRKQLDDQSPMSASQAMRYTPGVQPELRGGAGATRLELFTIRGFQAPTFLDGLRLIGSRDVYPTVDPFRLERIDIVKGPSSTLYGQSGPGGIVAMTSKVPRFVNHGEIFVQGGGFHEIRSGFDVGGPVPGSEQFAYRVVGLGWKGDGPVDATKIERQFIAPSFTWSPSSDTTMTVLAHYQHDPHSGYYGAIPSVGSVFPRDFGNGFVGRLSPRFYDGDKSYERSNRTQAAIGYLFDHRFSDSLRFHSGGRYLHTEGEYKSTFSTNGTPFDRGPLIPRSHGLTNAQIPSFAIDNYLEGKFETGPLHHTAVVGLDHFYQEARTYTSPFTSAPALNALFPNYFMGLRGPAFTARAHISSEQTGVYLQDQIKFGGFNLTLGGRFDRARSWGITRQLTSFQATGQDVTSEAFTGKASLLYLFDNGIAPYVAYTEAFEPIPAGRIYDPAFGDAGRLPEPIRSNQWEGGVKYQPPGTDILLTAAAFDIKRENALTADTTRPGQGFSLQSGEVRVKGLEFEARANLTSGLSLTGGVSVLDPRATKDTGTTLNALLNRQVPLQGRQPTAIPDKTASLFMNYEFQGGALLGLSIGGGVRYISSQWGDAANVFRVPASTLVDAMAKYEFKYIAPSLKGLEVQVNAQNLFNERYVSSCFGYTGCYFGPARTIYATLRYRW